MTEKTDEQRKAEAKEKRRAISLRNLTEKALQNLALAYFTNESKEFGEADNSVVENFKYMPAINGSTKYYNSETGKESNILTDSLLGSRQGGKRYTGNVSEYKIIQDAAAIIQESLANIRVGDVLNLTGSDVKSKYSNMYLSDLMQSGEDGKKLAENVIGTYNTYFISNGISDAYSQSAKAAKKGLETILEEPDETAGRRR